MSTDSLGRVPLVWEERLVKVFDVRIPGVAGCLHSERAYWQEQADIEALDQNHIALIVAIKDPSEVRL